MSAPPGQASPPPPSAPSPDGRGSVGLSALLLLAIGAAAIFWAGLSLGSGSAGRNAEERAAIGAFTELYRSIADDFIGSPVPEKVRQGALEGMVDALDDPYSRYMAPAEYDAALDDAEGEFEGIGAEMDTEDEGGAHCDVIGESCRLIVRRVLEGTPAEGAGLLAGDVVAEVDGESLTGSTLGDTVSVIRGPRGSEVTLGLVRDGQELQLPITRDTVTSEDVRSATLGDGRVGYISIDSFSGNAAADFAEALEQHLDSGIDALVVDVRDDPGGFVDATVAISSQFLSEGAVFWEEDARGTQVSVDVLDDGLATDTTLDVALLVNGGSASASEIFAGALQDAGRAALVGEPTFGKGTVQEWSELPGDNGGFRLSVAKWLTRDKHWIDGTGLTPDVPVAGGEGRFRAFSADVEPEDDLQLQTAVALLLGQELPAPSPSASPTPAVAVDGAE